MMKLRLLFFPLLIFLLPVLSFAQDGTENSLLPEINPQDIEIRSEFEARFPGLRRQPILGFNPKPRVYQMDPNRMPFMESREDAVADISITQLGRPDPPFFDKLFIPNRGNAYIRGGFGSYLSPEVQAYGNYTLNDNKLLTASVNAEASDGHLDDQQSSFRYLDFNARYFEKTNDRWRFSIEAGALADQHFLYYPGDNATAFNDETPEKEYIGGSTKVTIKKINNTLSGLEATGGGSIFETDLTAAPTLLGNSVSSGEISEKTYFAKFQKYWPGKNIYETFDILASIEGGIYDGLSTTGVGDQWVTARTAIEYERLFNFTTRIIGDAGIQYVSDPFSDQIYFTPEVEVTHNLTNAITITGNAYGLPEMQTLQMHHQYNRFLNSNTNLRHSYKTGANAEVNYQVIEGNRVFGGVLYEYIKDYSYYQREQVFPTTDYGFYNVFYGNANIFEIYTGISHQLVPEKFWADFKFYVRSPKLKSGGNIPYEERLGMDAAISYKPVSKLLLNAWAEYTGKRDNPAENDDLSAFILVNVAAEFQINDTFGVYGKMLNVLGQEYEIWKGYQERPFQIFGGLTIKF